MGASEQRQHRRYEVSDVDGTFVYQLDANVINLSIAGMLIETTSQLEVGRDYTFRVHQHEKEIELAGSVVWCEQASTGSVREGQEIPVFHAGVRVGDVLSEGAKQLQNLIEGHAVLEPDRRLFGRFRPMEKGLATLNTVEEFEVRSISHAGMRVETRLDIGPGTILDFELSFAGGRVGGTCRIDYVESSPDAEGRRPLSVGAEFLTIYGRGEERLEKYLSRLLELDNLGIPA
jgi:Tfp pilus assembly protein PilZ